MSLEVIGIKRSWPDFTIDVSFRVGKGELVSLLGPSGCGKTTTLHIIAGFIKPDTGKVTISGVSVNNLPPYLRKIGLVFQDYALFPNMNVFNNIAFGLRMAGWNRKKIERRVRDLLHLIRLDNYVQRNVTELSGGEQQRVALVRALAPRPNILLLDEPLSALDAKLRRNLRGEIKRIQKELGLTTVYVTHDQEEALVLSDRIVVMNNGRIEQIGTPSEIYNRPNTRFVADFVGTTNSIDARVSENDGSLAILEGPEGRFTANVTANVSVPGVFEKGERVVILVRPENCALYGSKEKSNIINGTVQSSEYVGDSTHVKITTKHGVYTAKLSGMNHRQVGEKANIAFSRDDCWLLRKQKQ
jgi:putative spermidine/putrescine transport system ATP-binding protein